MIDLLYILPIFAVTLPHCSVVEKWIDTEQGIKGKAKVPHRYNLPCKHSKTELISCWRAL